MFEQVWDATESNTEMDARPASEDNDPFDDDGEYDVNLDFRMDFFVDSDCESEAIIERNECSSDNDDNDDDYEKLASISSSADFYEAKNGTKWYKDPPTTARVRAHNIVNYARRTPGPLIGTHNPLAIFKSIFSEEISNLIIRETNRKAASIFDAWNAAHPEKQQEWIPLTMMELNAFLAILLHAGLCNSSNEPARELWSATHPPLYKAAMPYNRFKLLKRCIRFDNGNTRASRLLTSKTAAIDDVWTMLQSNLEAAYIPHASLIVDEQLFPYKGRSPITQHIQSKCGINVWWLCDAKSHYPLKGIINAGKFPEQKRDAQQSQKVMQNLVQKYLFTGRTIYADNFFTSLDLAKTLITQKTAFVGTLSTDKPYIPHEFLKGTKREVHSTLFGFYEGDVCLCSYVPKKNKAVLLLSTKHYTSAVADFTATKKPQALIDYDTNKSGVNTMDQILGKYTCKRSTNRWPLAMFFNALDVAALASFIIYNEQNPSGTRDGRRSFIHILIKQLAIPNIELRATNARITRLQHIRNAMIAFDVVPISPVVPGPGSVPFAPRERRPNCYLCREFSNRQRKTRFYCYACNKAVCMEHSEQMQRCEICRVANLNK